MTEDQKRDEVFAIVQAGKAMRASDAVIAGAVALFFATNGFPAPKSLVAWLGESGRYVRATTIH